MPWIGCLNGQQFTGLRGVADNGSEGDAGTVSASLRTTSGNHSGLSPGRSCRGSRSGHAEVLGKLVAALAAFRTADDSAVLAAADERGNLTLWDPLSGSPPAADGGTCVVSVPTAGRRSDS